MSIIRQTPSLDDVLDLPALADRVAALRRRLDGRIVFTTSLGLEDQAITDAVARSGANIEVVTLDTGRLFPETLDLLEQTRARYGLAIAAAAPAPADVADYAVRYGMDGFYDSVAARQRCCHVRKVLPLQRTLAGVSVWLTGLRRSQSDHREGMPFAEFDAAHGVLKVNPLIDWSAAQVRDYIAAHDVPVNALHARGYPSIGCEPCTRAIRPGEHERAGRWWWERESSQECGLHVKAAEGD